MENTVRAYVWLVTIAALAFVLSGCGPSTFILRDPKTGALASCQVGQEINAISRTNACIAGYQAQGFTVVNSY